MAYARTYNMFRRSDALDIFCAVGQDRPVPGFIDGVSWLFHGTMRDDGAIPAGFLPHVAREASDLNGFYLFLMCKRRPCSPGKGLSSARTSFAIMAA